MSENRKIIRPKDFAIILIIILLALCLFYYSRSVSREKVTAVIFVHGEEYDRVDLSKVRGTQTFELDADLHVEITAVEGEIFFSFSQCPDQICVRTGRLSWPHQSAACLSAGVSIILE